MPRNPLEIQQSLISRVLARLYESDKGVLSLIGLFVAAFVKLLDEVVKRLA
jgi:hypothetical protein